MWWCQNCIFQQEIRKNCKGITVVHLLRHHNSHKSKTNSTTTNYLIRLHSTITTAAISKKCLILSLSNRLKILKNCSTNNNRTSHLTKNFISLPGGFGPIKRKEFAERRIMGFSAEQMFDVVVDVDNYIDFLPWCESSIVKSRSSSQIVADLVIGMKPVTESYTSVVTFKRPSMIRAESKDGGKHFNHMLTTWKFSPGLRGVPQSCLIDFYVSFEFRSSFHSQIANIFFNEVVKAMASAFYVEAKKRYGKESIPSRRVALIPSATGGGAGGNKSKSDDDNVP